jgi:hypothetical protein
MYVSLQWVVLLYATSTTICLQLIDNKVDASSINDFMDEFNALSNLNYANDMDAILDALPVCGMCAENNSPICLMCHLQLLQFSRSSSRPTKRVHASNVLQEYMDEAHDDDGDDYGTVDVLLNRMEKRSPFLTCKCCISLNNKQCCKRCSLTPYYGKRSQ